MHSVSPRPQRHAMIRFASAASLTILLMLAAALARAQCTISGPDVMCGGTATLCGPSGNSDYTWTGPNGFTATTKCINVSVPGVYSLRFFDGNNGLWFGPCSHTLAGGSGVASSITGPSSACIGTPINLCGPSGNLSYAWSGPNGFSDVNACIQANTAGMYQLVVTDLTSGCPSAPCSLAVSFNVCSSSRDNCPRPAWFWSRQCGDHHGDHALGAEQISSVAGCVDQHSDLFSWSSPADEFCATLHMSSHPTLRGRAKRQFAAVAANVCASQMLLSTAGGTAIGIDPATPLESGTVGTWMADADHQLMTLEGLSLHSRAVKAAYRQIIRAGWNINHGHGVGPVCGRPEHSVQRGINGNSTLIGAGSSVPGDESGSDVSDAASEDSAEPLEAELTDDGEAELLISRISPNPTSNRASISYELVASSSQPVSLGIYDLAGRRLRQLVSAPQSPGLYMIDWDGRDSFGQQVPGGVYFVRGHVGNQPVQSRLTLVR